MMNLGVASGYLKDVVSRSAAALALAAALLLNASARADEATPSEATVLPAFEGFKVAGDEEKRINMFFGLGAGLDTNVSRRPSGSEEAATPLEALAGVSVRMGNLEKSYDFRCQGRRIQYSDADNSKYDRNEAQATLNMSQGAEVLRFRLYAEYAMLSDAIAEWSEPLLDRNRLALAPGVDMSFGKLELGLDGALTTATFPDAGELDYGDMGGKVECRLALSEGQRFFAHMDMGNIDYSKSARSDFRYQRLYGGWRAENARRSSVELGYGTDTLDSFSADPSLSFSGTYLAFRSKLSMKGERAALDLSYSVDADAAANAAYKEATRWLVRYASKSSDRLSWSAGVNMEDSTFTSEKPGTPTRLISAGVNGGLQLELGSPGRWHGRFVGSLEYEMNDANVDTYDYTRLRLVGWLALVK